MSATLSPPPARPPVETPPSIGHAPLELPLARPVTNPGQGIDYELFLDCVHCGLCTASCPTYVETGNENDGPRGRIYLMRAVTDGKLSLNHEVRRHLELCLDCRACETACPSGVQYGKLIEPFRVNMEHLAGDAGKTKTDDWFHKYILFGLFTNPKLLTQQMRLARIAQMLWLDKLVVNTGLWRLLPSRLGRLVTMLPKLEKPLPPLPDFLPAKGKRRARVALFAGCIGDVMFRQTNWATARVLAENGCDVVVPQTQACCGAIHFHAGSSEPAQSLADQNVAAFRADGVDAIIVNVAGCGSMLKDYGHHWHDAGDAAQQHDRERFAAKVKDVSEFLDELGLITPHGEINVSATYHDACHLAHAQKIREQPRNILKRIPGLKLVDLPESDLCCGAAGTYHLTEPDLAERLGRRKLDNIRATGARLVITSNAGCLLQIARQARMEGETLKIVHPMDVLDVSYRRESLRF